MAQPKQHTFIKEHLIKILIVNMFITKEPFFIYYTMEKENKLQITIRMKDNMKMV